MNNTKNNLNKYVFFIGLAVVVFSFVPYIILKEDSFIPYHDQLDVEFINYIYQAKYLFSGSNIIPEFLNGASKTAMTPPAPFAVIFFKLFHPFTAYMALQFICQIIAYVGMYALSREVSNNGLVAFTSAMFFTYAPFFPVHGLSIYGTPMLILSILYLYRKKHRVWSYAYIGFYTMMSSLVLCGFTWMGFWLLGLILLALFKQISKHRDLVIGFFLMLCIYIIENISLLGQMFGFIESNESHKSELVLNGENLWTLFWNYLRNNDYHSSDNHVWILYLTCIVALMLWVWGKYLKKYSGVEWSRVKQKRALMTGILLFIMAVCFVAALTDSHIGVSVREHLGVLKAFKISRIIWALPALWYIEFALCLDILWNFKGWIKWTGYLLTVPMLLCFGFIILKSSWIKPCVQELLLPDYDNISYSDYLAIGILDQVEAYIEKEEGLEKSEYKVASLGIEPAAALYHGFFCVDGYSNNYDLEYKHKFREVIAPELERNDWLKSYYDDWGNRCYLFFAEVPGYINVRRDSCYIVDYRINTKALKNLGCDYILSAVYIVNAEEIGLKWLGEDTFKTDDSFYQIFIYKLID